MSSRCALPKLPLANPSIPITSPSFPTLRTSPASVVSKCVGAVDRCANGCVIGQDCRPIPDCPKTHRSVDVGGIDRHQITDIPILSAAGVTQTQRGSVIAIFHQGAFTGKGKSILSSGQMEWYKNKVNDKSIKVDGGLQCIETLDGYAIPSQAVNAFLN